MSKFQYEIPFKEDRRALYRFYEILPGALSWSILAFPIVLSFVNVRLVAILMISYLMLWFIKAVALNIRVVQGYKVLNSHMKVNWQVLSQDLDNPNNDKSQLFPKWHYENKLRRIENKNTIKSENVVHAVIIATWNESLEVLKPTLEYVASSSYDKKKMIVLLAYEQRGGDAVEKQAIKLMKEYEGIFLISRAVKHIDAPGEVVGKGGNITYAGRELEKIVKKHSINTNDVIITTLDADNRPHKSYFACLTYIYTICHDPKYMSFQPIPMFTNNIWDAPAPMRVIATGNSYWMMVQALRQHMLRNFSAHSQSLYALIETDFWSVRTIVEDGHQFWRSYFAFDGKHEVIPIFLPVYQDAVLADGYRRTLKAQFIQLRRWAWGASDIAYVAYYGFHRKNNIPKFDLIAKFLRLLEGHVSWATSPLILAFGAIMPWLFNQTDFLANQLPQISSKIQTFAMFGILITLFLSFKILPPKPARYKRHRSIFMILQWGLLPLTTIFYSSFAAINSQTRLMFKRYLGKFDVTEKAVKKDNGETIGSL